MDQIMPTEQEFTDIYERQISQAAAVTTRSAQDCHVDLEVL
jgi:hypothetical protein